MIDVVRVAMIHGIDDLEEGGFNSGRVTSVCDVVVDQVVEAASGTIVEKGGGVVVEFDVLM